ncbi:MAG: hypothetical protein AB8H80_12830 [Planctomycetota bacterium]
MLDAPTRDLEAGWLLARNLGRASAPLLWELLDSERSNVDRRVVLLIAAMLAGGPAEDERLFTFLDQAKTMLHERAMAAFVLSLGPRRLRPVRNFRGRLLRRNGEVEPLLDVAARLASTRFPKASDGAATTFVEDAGILAASAYAGLPIARDLERRWWQTRSRNANARETPLFLRGALLGSALRAMQSDQPAQRLNEARRLLRTNEQELQSTRAAAMLLLAQAEALDGQPRPDWPLLQVAVSSSVAQEPLARWLGPTALPRDPEPARLAVAFALRPPIQRVLDSVPDWRGQRTRHAFAIALAVRLLRGDPLPRPLKLELPDTPEWRFVVWASGGSFGNGYAFDDGHLRQLAQLVVADRASRSAARDALEAWLWRRGSHPGIGPWRLERELVRDLLLAGSSPGSGKYFPNIRKDQIYFPTGLDRDDRFFQIAVRFYEFSSRPVGPVPYPFLLR